MAVSSPSSGTSKRSGFTLIEVILAVAISGIVMAAMASFLYSTAQAYSRETFLNAHDEHIQGVSGFLRQVMLESQASEQKLQWSTLPGDENREPEYLRFQLSQPNPLFTYGDITPSSLQCFLKVTDAEDFILLWRPSLMPIENENDPALFKLEITNQLSNIAYYYFQEEEEDWEKEEDPIEGDDGLLRMPEYLELTFKAIDGTPGKAIRISLPNPNSHPLIL
ncbi:MAG: prepilin-type N-terminal cleavage/methylation domain-containing protein [Verrucomicrobiota bacterium]